MTDGEQLDMLTKLRTFPYLEEKVQEYLNAGTEFYLVLIDLDNCGKINGLLGETFGDAVISAISNRIYDMFSQEDTVVRAGGDEFAIIIRSILKQEQLQDVLLQLCEVIRKIYTGEKAVDIISASVGVVFSGEEKEFYELFDKAKTAMFYVKSNGKDGICFYDSTNKELDRIQLNSLARMPVSSYTTYDIYSSVDNDKFAYELTDVAFRLMEETQDVDSVVNILLRKVADYYKVSVAAIREVVDQSRSMRVMYEYCRDDSVSKIGEIHDYTPEQWNEMRSQHKSGRYIFNSKTDEMMKTVVEIPMYNMGCFIGCLDMIDYGKDRHFKESEIYVLKTFSRIVSAYLLNMRAFHNMEDVMEKWSERDTVTGLYRYEYFVSHLKDSVPKIIKDYNLAIVDSDIKHFKYVNDTYGYSKGDEVLREFARMATEGNEKMVCATRLFSDNIIVATKISKDVTDEEIIQIVKRYNEKMETRFRDMFGDADILINSGIYVMDRECDVETCISNANFARKKAKNAANNNAILFKEDMLNPIRRKMQLISELSNAIAAEELVVYYQPKVSAKTQETVGAEALIRWRKPDGSFIYPDEFIPVFEESGNIIEVDYFVYNKVFSYLKKRIARGLKVVPVSLNVSRVHLFKGNIVEYVKILYQRYNIPRDLVEFELTESVYVENHQKVIELANNLRKLGAKVSIDDFGSMYSSFGVLSDVHVDTIKIDKSFMKNAELTSTDKIIVSTMIGMAKKMDIRIVCEGVETAQQAEFLKEAECDVIQGYYFAKPMPQEEFDKYIQ